MARHLKALRKVSILAAVVAVALTLAGGIGVIRAPVTHASGDPFPDQIQGRWSGLVQKAPSAGIPVYARVTVPKVICNVPGNISMWVGYDGATTTTVEQTGVGVTCNPGGHVSYDLWYEFFDQAGKRPEQDILNNVAARLRPGDTVDMYADGPVSVCTHYIGKLCVWWGDGVYFSLIAKTANGAYLGSWSQTFSIPFSAKFASRECVIEGPWNYDFDPKHPERGLPNFGTITFQDCELLNNLNNSVDVDEIYNPATGHVLARVTGVYGIEPHTYIDIRWMAAR